MNKLKQAVALVSNSGVSIKFFKNLSVIFFSLLLFLYGSFVRADFTSTVVSMHSGKCLDLTNGLTTNGANVQQLTCDGSSKQSLTFIPIAGKTDIYQIKFVHSGLCLGVYGGSKKNGATFVQWACDNSLNQTLKLYALGNNFYVISPQHSHKVVDIKGVSKANGADVDQWKWLNAASQKWRITISSSDPSPVDPDPSNEFTTAVKSVHSGKCIEVTNGSNSNAANVQQLTCDGSTKQNLNFIPVPGKPDIYQIKFAHSGQCLDVYGGSNNKGATLIQWPCHSGLNQQFKLNPLGNNNYSLIAQHSNKVVDVENVSKANGADIHQWDWLNANNQKWLLLTANTPDNKATQGQWSHVIGWPHIAIAAATLPDGRVLTWASNEKNAFPVAATFTHSAIFNSANNSFQTTNNPNHDMFCAGISLLEDGTVLASGGNPQLRNTSLFNSVSSSWIAGPLMNQQRWYGTSLTLPNGEVFATFAKGANNTPEVYTPGGAWTDVPQASMANLWNEQNLANANPVNNSTTAQWFAFMNVAPDGRVFHSGPTQTMHWFDTDGGGNVVNAGPRLNGDRHRQFGSSVMYDIGKLLITGGNDQRLNPPSTASAMTIDISGSAPIVNSTQAMKFARVNHNAVMLPTGDALIIGGNSSGRLFSDEGSALTPELWNPQTGKWQNMADMSIPRNYHSIALLLQDGRVLSAGGGLCGNGCQANHQDGQIFSPPYLFNSDGSAATRPVINSGPTQTRSGNFFNVSSTGTISKFSMIRLSSATHSVNTDQRFIPVDFQPQGGSNYELVMDENPNVLIPGNYWLFAINAQGVPSIGRLIKVVQDF